MTETAPILLLPGLLCDAAVWTDQRRALGERRCVVPAYDDCASIAAMAERTLGAAPPGRFLMAGHSLGGRVALEILRLAPQRVIRAALLDTGVDPLPPGEGGERERAKRYALIELARRDGMRAMGRAWARGMVHPSRVDTPVFEAILAMIERKSLATFERHVGALLARPDARPMLTAARCPILLACGRDDAWSPVAQHEAMQRVARNARLAIVEASGHMTTMEEPEAVSALLVDWAALPDGVA